MHPRFRKHLVTCALLAGLGAAAQAQTPPAAPAGSAPAQGRHVDPAKRAEMMNKRMADLKQKLQITGSQEQAWGSFTAAMQPPANPQRPDPAALAAMTTPDRLDHMRALRSQRDAEMDRRAEATKAFYAQLTPEQKKTFDSETARMFRPRGEGGMHRRQHG